MARFSVDETKTTKPESASRFTVEEEQPATSADSRFQVEEESNSQDYVFPAGSPSARPPMVYKDKPSFEESFPPSTDKSSAFQKIEGLANTIVGSVVKPIEWATEKYEEYVGGPIRRTMFKEDPLVTLDRQHRERQAVLEATGASEGQKTLETAKHIGKSMVASVLADPLSGLMGKRVFSQGEKAIVDPGANAGVWQGPIFHKQEWQGPPVQVWQGPEKQGTSVDLSTLNKPKPTNPLPTITELADDSRYAPGTGPAGAFSDEMLTKKMRRSPESIAGRAAPGMVRVYRGESSAASSAPDWVEQGVQDSGGKAAQGRWWTTDPKIAEWYAKDAGASGRVVYQDVPADVVNSSRVAELPREVRKFSLDPENELFLPEEFVGKGSPISELAGHGPDMVPPQTESLGLPTTARDRARYNKEMTVEFEKPGFLRTAEEKVQDKNALRTAEESVKANEPKQARDFERTRRELIAAEESRIQARIRTKERLAAEREAMIKEREAAQAEVPAHKQQWQGPYEEWQAGGFQGPRAPNRYWTPEQAGFSRDVDGNVTISDGSFPKPWQRFVARSLDTLGGSGETGQALRSIYYGMDDFARQSTAANFADWVRKAQTIYPKNSKPGIFRDPRREWSYRDYVNIPDKEYEVLVDLWYTNGQELTRYNALSRDAQIRVDSAFDLWQIATGRASSDPGVRRLNIRNSVTGEEKPMGEPGAFMPHQYRTGIDTGKVSRTLMNRMYESYAKNNPAPMSFNDFRETYTKRAAGYESIVGDDGKTRWVQSPPERRFLGVEEARLFDAAEVAREEGKSILQVMKEHGLETDMAKIQLRYNLGAYHRGQLKLNEEKIAKLQANWRQEVDFDADAVSWLDTLDSRYKGLAMHEDIERMNARWLQQIKSYNALTLLSRATLGAANQFFTYGLAKPTWGALLDRMMAPIGSKEELIRVTDMVPDSGALLSNFVQEMNRVDGFLGAASMAQLRLTGFNYLDRIQRVGAAKLGYFYAKDLAKKLVRKPDDKGIRYQLEELRLNPDEVLDSMTTTGQLSDALAKRAMQVYADTSMGTSGVRGRPLYATSSHWAPQLLLNIRGQLVSNMAEAKRMIFDAPDFMTGVDKAARLIVGAALAGTTTMAIRDAITGHLGELRGSAKELKKKFGNDMVARVVDGIIYGMGTTATDATIMMLAPGDDVRGRFASGIIGTPMTQINRLADAYTGIRKDPGRTILKNIPSPVPLDFVAEEAGVIRKKQRQ